MHMPPGVSEQLLFSACPSDNHVEVASHKPLLPPPVQYM